MRILILTLMILSSVHATTKRPNILFILGEDASASHFGPYGGQAITPTFDKLAKEGLLFTNAHATSPQCSPMKFSVLTGKMPWQAASPAIDHNIRFSDQFVTYPEALQKTGYFIGKNGKGGWRRTYDKNPGPRKNNPAGPSFVNLEAFLKKCPSDKPFCFWATGKSAHWAFRFKGKSIKKDKITIQPDTLDCPEIRRDILGYLKAINEFDTEMAQTLQALKASGRADNTLIIAMPGDHGWPFPRGKCNLYTMGTQVPLVLHWPKKVAGGNTCDELVSVDDVYATIMEAASLPYQESISGQSLLKYAVQGTAGKTPDRECLVLGRGFHDVYYPSRAIRTRKHLYIRNYRPELLAQGPEFKDGVSEAAPIRNYYLKNRKNKDVSPFFEAGFGKRPAEELYDLTKDPFQLNNLAADAALAKTKKALVEKMVAFQEKYSDPVLTHQGKISEDEIKKFRLQ